MTAPDYEAIAERWLKDDLQIIFQESRAADLKRSLTALLERLCGEARREPDPLVVELLHDASAKQEIAEAQLSEARAEVEKFRFLWIEGAEGSARQRERAEKAEADHEITSALATGMQARAERAESANRALVEALEEIERAAIETCNRHPVGTPHTGHELVCESARQEIRARAALAAYEEKK